MPTAVHKRALQRAVELAGGVEPLSIHLHVPATAIRFWLNASSPLPDDIFLKIVDLLLDRSLSELYPPSPARPSQPKTDS
jgi:hypothetical protein